MYIKEKTENDLLAIYIYVCMRHHAEIYLDHLIIYTAYLWQYRNLFIKMFCGFNSSEDQRKVEYIYAMFSVWKQQKIRTTQ